MIPKRFKNYIFTERRIMIEKIAKGEVKDKQSIYLWFTRALPAIVTHGPVGLNASIKMVGFVLKEQFIRDFLEKIYEFLAERKKNRKEILELLLGFVYDENKIDFTKLITLDLAKKKTWENLKDGGEAVLIFFTPPDISFMVKADVEVHLEGSIYFEYANALHDLFHVVPYAERIVGRNPTYVFKIKEKWDKSVDAFGKRIYP